MKHDVKLTYRNSRTAFWVSGQYGRARGTVNGVRFLAVLLKGDHALRGAEPLVWRVYGQDPKRSLTKGERLAVAIRLKKCERRK